MSSSVSIVPPDLLPVQTFQHRQLLPVEQHQLWQIKHGMVRTLTWDQDGTISTLGLWGVGDILGPSLFAADPYQIECLGDVQASPLPNDYGSYTHAMFSHLYQMETLLKIAHVRSIGHRLWQLLVWLDQRFGQDVEGGRLIDLPMTHQDLAETIGSSRVTVTRMLNVLKREGVLQFSHKSYTLCRH